jgi:hypothetical protein
MLRRRASSPHINLSLDVTSVRNPDGKSRCNCDWDSASRTCWSGFGAWPPLLEDEGVVGGLLPSSGAGGRPESTGGFGFE